MTNIPQHWTPFEKTRTRIANGERADCYENNRYAVAVYPDINGIQCAIIQTLPPLRPIHNWRHLQRIKNELFGPEREAVELYPAESRLVDTTNSYWLWVMPEGKRIDLGHFGGRKVSETNNEPWEEDNRPADLDNLETEEEMKRVKAIRILDRPIPRLSLNPRERAKERRRKRRKAKRHNFH